MIKQIIRTAVESGFFSIWMKVFEGEAEVLNALIAAYPGTAKDFFDEKGNAKAVIVK